MATATDTAYKVGNLQDLPGNESDGRVQINAGDESLEAGPGTLVRFEEKERHRGAPAAKTAGHASPVSTLPSL